MSKKIETDLVVIGGGPGGYPAAFRAADLGMEVTLVDPEKNPGGVCLYRGCIPSKALLHIAKVLHEVEAAKAMGVTFSKPKIDITKLREWKESVVNRLTGGLGGLAQARNIKTIRGRAKFIDAQTLEIDLVDGGKQTLQFKNAIIATGSRPAQVPIFPESEKVLDSTTALELVDIPKKLLVVGGGYIGLEMATVYNALGSQVYVVEMMPNLLMGADKDLVMPLAKRLKKEYAGIMLDTKVMEVKIVEKGVKVKFEGKNAIKPEMVFDKILVSVGRKPNSEDLGLEHTGVKVSDRGFIEIDPQRRTGEPHIYAIGDVAGDPMLAHKATHEGTVAVEAIAGKKTVFNPQVIPAVVFTDPEIAWAGLTESEAKDQGIEVKVAKFPWSASGRATTLERNDGLTKLIVDPETERILGVGMTGVNAGDMISEGVIAIEMGANVEDLALSIHPHPTLSETVMEAAEAFHGQSAHFYQKK